ncbi:hypothetical protein ACFLYF_02860 [Chloroflexota bacterium]
MTQDEAGYSNRGYPAFLLLFSVGLSSIGHGISKNSTNIVEYIHDG